MSDYFCTFCGCRHEPLNHRAAPELRDALEAVRECQGMIRKPLWEKITAALDKAKGESTLAQVRASEQGDG